MAVGVIRQNPLKDEALDLHERTAGSDIVRIYQRPGAERPFDNRILANQPVPQPGDRIALPEPFGEAGQHAAGGDDGGTGHEVRSDESECP